MRLDPDSLVVQSFSAGTTAETAGSSWDTGKGGPASECWICYNTDFGLPSCEGGWCTSGSYDINICKEEGDWIDG